MLRHLQDRGLAFKQLEDCLLTERPLAIRLQLLEYLANELYIRLIVHTQSENSVVSREAIL